MMFRVYLLGKTVVVKPIDGRNNLIGQVMPDRETAVLVYQMIAGRLADQDRLCPDSCILD